MEFRWFQAWKGPVWDLREWQVSDIVFERKGEVEGDLQSLAKGWHDFWIFYYPS